MPALVDSAPPRLSSAGQAQRQHVQPGLHVLLLPVQRGALSELQEPHVGSDAGALHPPVAGVAHDADGDRGLAGRRTHAHGRWTSSSGQSSWWSNTAVPTSRWSTRSRRTACCWTMTGALSSRRTTSWSAERGRPAGDPRHVSREPRRRRHLRPGHARLARAAPQRGGLQHPVHRECRQPASRPRGLPLLPRRAGRHVDAVHPHRASGPRRRRWTSPTRAGASSRARAACSTRRRATW